MKSVLVLGAGLVSRPIVSHILHHTQCNLVVASLEHDHAAALVGDHPRGDAREVDVTDERSLAPLVARADVVISLVPYAFHTVVARVAIDHRVSMVTSSYVSDAMRALDREARDAGVLILNETGLDPGIDHMSAMRVIRAVQARGDRVVGFSSCCGGLPAPEAADNPWKYKFSWSPRGALLASRQPARFVENASVVEIEGPRLFDAPRALPIPGLGLFEVYPNRDAVRYVELYGLEGVRDMFRGTIRYPGWSNTMRVVAKLDLLSTDLRAWPAGTTYADFVESFVPPGPGSLRSRVAAHAGVPADDDALERLAWSGLFSTEPILRSRESALDVVADRFERLMRYRPGERDMVVLRHEFTVERGDGTLERLVSRLIAFGDPDGYSATARTVSLPAAIAAEMILDGQVDLTGVRIPVLPELYEPILEGLAELGLAFEERSERVDAD